MRLGIDATFFGTVQPTGLGVYSRCLINALLRLHNDVEIWTVDDHGFAIDRSRLHPVMSSLPLPRDKAYLLRPLWLETVFRRHLRRARVDLLYSPVPGGMRSCPVPHLVTVHDLTPLTVAGDSPWPVTWSFRHRLPKILRQAAAIIAVSQHTKNDLCSWYGLEPERIRVIPGAHDAEHFYPDPDTGPLARHGLDRAPYLLAVGSANRRKNLASLLAAVATIRERLPHLVVLAGPRSRTETTRILQLADRHGVSQRLRLLPYLSLAELRVLYSHASLFAYLSLYEGFGIPVLEAMACGTPVLAANATSIPEVAGPAALLVNPLDVEEIGHGIMELVNDSQRRRELVRQGLQQAQKFSWQLSAQRLLALCRQLSG